jgi:hypothetical protein
MQTINFIPAFLADSKYFLVTFIQSFIGGTRRVAAQSLKTSL